MVAIKQRMNMDEDITDLTDGILRIQAKIDASDVQADIDAWNAEITANNNRITELQTHLMVSETVIAGLTEAVTSTSAIALSI